MWRFQRLFLNDRRTVNQKSFNNVDSNINFPHFNLDFFAQQKGNHQFNLDYFLIASNNSIVPNPNVYHFLEKCLCHSSPRCYHRPHNQPSAIQQIQTKNRFPHPKNFPMSQACGSTLQHSKRSSHSMLRGARLFDCLDHFFIIILFCRQVCHSTHRVIKSSVGEFLEKFPRCVNIPRKVCTDDNSRYLCLLASPALRMR